MEAILPRDWDVHADSSAGLSAAEGCADPAVIGLMQRQMDRPVRAGVNFFGERRVQIGF